MQNKLKKKKKKQTQMGAIEGQAGNTVFKA